MKPSRDEEARVEVLTQRVLPSECPCCSGPVPVHFACDCAPTAEETAYVVLYRHGVLFLTCPVCDSVGPAFAIARGKHDGPYLVPETRVFGPPPGPGDDFHEVHIPGTRPKHTEPPPIIPQALIQADIDTDLDS